MSNSIRFVEGEPTALSELVIESDRDFLINNDLIEVDRHGLTFSVNFVGEIKTPSNTFYSLPKHFEKTNDNNINLIKAVLFRYSKFATKNFSSTLSEEGIKAEKYFYNRLKEFFLDYITYEFIYPEQKLKIHSATPVSGGKINVFDTIKNSDRYGIGATYNIKNIKNDDKWMIDDIYWHTLIELAKTKKYATEKELKEINDMKKYLDGEGYIIKPLSELIRERVLPVNYTNSDLIKGINNSDVGIIHQPIKKILLDYYLSKKIKSGYEIDIFYTENFPKVWEELICEALKSNTKENKKFPLSEELKKECMKDYIAPHQYKFTSNQELDTESVFGGTEPDIISRYKKGSDIISFIGDAKYYGNPSKAHFEKEMYIYNTAINNKYPMVVFIPSDKTERLDVRRQGPFELVVMMISVEDAINDAINDGHKVLYRTYEILSRASNRWDRLGYPPIKRDTRRPFK